MEEFNKIVVGISSIFKKQPVKAGCLQQVRISTDKDNMSAVASPTERSHNSDAACAVLVVRVVSGA